MMNCCREGAGHKGQTGDKYIINIGCKNVGNEPYGIHRHIWKDHNKINI